MNLEKYSAQEAYALVSSLPPDHSPVLFIHVGDDQGDAKKEMLREDEDIARLMSGIFNSRSSEIEKLIRSKSPRLSS